MIPQEGSEWACRTRHPNNGLWFRRVRKNGELVRIMPTNKESQGFLLEDRPEGFAGESVLDPGTASAGCGSRAGDRARSDVTVPGGTHDAPVAGSRDSTERLQAVGWGLWNVPAMLMFGTRI